MGLSMSLRGKGAKCGKTGGASGQDQDEDSEEEKPAIHAYGVPKKSNAALIKQAMESEEQTIAAGLTLRQVLTSDGGALIFENSANNEKKVTVDVTGSQNVMIDDGENAVFKHTVSIKPGRKGEFILKIMRKNENIELELGLNLVNLPVEEDEPEISEQWLQMVDQIWDQYDADGSGVLERHEARRMFSNVFSGESLGQFDRKFAMMDANGDGVVSKVEMGMFLQEHCQWTSSSPLI